jgi:lauroyl/myristoyl acyltransferase
MKYSVGEVAKAGARSVLSGILSRQPEGKRFDAAFRLSRMLVRLPPALAIGISGAWTESRILLGLLDLANQRGWTFTPRVRVSGIELVRQHYTGSGRLMLCSGHSAPLNWALTRALSDCGFPVTLVARDPQMKVWGNGKELPTITRSSQTWVRVRTALLQGQIVLLLGDHGFFINLPQSHRRQSYVPSHDPWPFFSLGPFAVARLTQTPVLMFASRLGHDGTIEIIIEGPVALGEGDEGLKAAAEACIQFLARFKEIDNAPEI